MENNKKHVLIVDDDDRIRDLLKDFLSNNGYIVSTAENADQAKEEVTVELFEAMVPIPITVRGDHVRVLEKEAN